MPTGAVIDCDIHQEVNDEDELLPYLSEAWREFYLAPEVPGHRARNKMSPPIQSFGLNPYSYERRDAWPPDGSHPGSSPEFMLEQLGEAYDVGALVLTGDNLQPSANHNPYYAQASARALND